MPRARRFAPYVIAFASLGLGCQRGCVWDWFKKSPLAEAPSTPISFDAIDCPDGLARCFGGTIEVSRVARVPQPCVPQPDKPCGCPWDAVDTCPRGCASEGVEIVVSRERAAARLCAPDPTNPVARPAPAALAPPAACEAEGYRCVQSLVVTCATEPGDAGSKLAARVVAACLRGCAQEGESLGEEEADPEGATRILCAR